MGSERIPVAIIGGSGYGAGEILRLLSYHPSLSAVSVVSRSHAGKCISTVHTHLNGIYDMPFESALRVEKLRTSDRSAVVVCVPHGESVKTIKALYENGLPDGCVVVDLSGDLRLRELALHERFYSGVPFQPELRERAIYGLPEVNRTEIAKAGLISNPGCLATAAVLALLPLVKNGFNGGVVVDAKTGTSGAGREPQPSMHHPARFSDFTAYKVLEHRHEPEILQALGDPLGSSLSMMFVPHLLPVSRGIIATCYVNATAPQSSDEISRLFCAYYSTSTFVRIRPTPPRLADVVGTNFCDIFTAVRGKQVVVMSALDNLGKGMAGQAIQNLNIAFGLPDEAGLKLSALGPV